MTGLDRRYIRAVHVQCMATGGWMMRQQSYYKAGAASVTAWTVGLSAYGGMPKPGSTYSHSGNLHGTLLAENGPKVIIEAVSAL